MHVVGDQVCSGAKKQQDAPLVSSAEGVHVKAAGEKRLLLRQHVM